MRIAYDTSAKATPESPSLNECLYAGPALQNKLWDTLVRQRAYPVVVTGDIQKAFLQIRIRECEHNTLRFHWRKAEQANIEILRFTHALFGLAPSPFLLQGVLEVHLDAWEKREPEMVAELRCCLFVDDLLSGGKTTSQSSTRPNTQQRNHGYEMQNNIIVALYWLKLELLTAVLHSGVFEFKREGEVRSFRSAMVPKIELAIALVYSRYFEICTEKWLAYHQISLVSTSSRPKTRDLRLQTLQPALVVFIRRISRRKY